MGNKGKHPLILVALCLLVEVSGHDLKRTNDSRLNHAFSPVNKAMALKYILLTQNRSLKASPEIEAQDDTTLENNEKEARIPKRNSDGKTSNFFGNIYSNSSSTPPTLNVPSLFGGPPVLNNKSQDVSNGLSKKNFSGAVMTAYGNFTKEYDTTFAGFSLYEPPLMMNFLERYRETPLVYYMVVGENCTKTYFRSDMPHGVSECSLAAVPQLQDNQEDLSWFQSPSLTTDDSHVCDDPVMEADYLTHLYVRNGSITFQSSDQLFRMKGPARPRKDASLCLRLIGPPQRIFEVGVENPEKWISETEKFVEVDFVFQEMKYLEELANGRVLQSDNNDTVLAVRGLFWVFRRALAPLKVTLTFQTVPWCQKRHLQAECPTQEKPGYIQTPFWDGQSTYDRDMLSCATLNIPPAHSVMVSFVSLDVDMCLDCRCEVVEIFLSPGCEGVPESRICDSSEALPVTYQTRTLSVLFKSSFGEETGFRLLYSFYSQRHTPIQLSDGKWVCSGARGSLLAKHFQCSFETFCDNDADRIARGCPSADVCGVTSFEIGRKCYRHIKPSRSSTWNDARKLCEKNMGYLVSLNTEEEWKEVGRFKRNIVGAGILMVGLSQSSNRQLLDLYSSMWQWSDSTMAYHLKIGDVGDMFCSSYCAVLGKNKHSLDLVSCSLPLQANILCEIEPEEKEPSPRVKIELPLPSVKASKHHYMVECPKKHATLDFFQCDRSSRCYGDEKRDFRECFRVNPRLAKSMFACRDQQQYVHYSLLCNYRHDCTDGSDEDFCTYTPCAHGHVSCRTTKQCILQRARCDGTRDCEDGSDELQCCKFASNTDLNTVSPPAIVNFIGGGDIIVRALDISHAGPSCPETHFQCPGNGYCLPVFVRCNDVKDCPGGEDEADCEAYTCPGYYRCHSAKNCVHVENICDGIMQCPKKDDELICDMICPLFCRCIGFAFFCDERFPVHSYSELRYLNADGTNMNLQDLAGNLMLISVSMRFCNINDAGVVTLPNLLSLDLSNNHLTTFRADGLQNLRSLSLAFNKLLSLDSLYFANITFPHLVLLDMSGSGTRVIHDRSFLPFRHLQTLDLSGSRLQRVETPGFSVLHKLRILDVSGCPITEVDKGTFRNMTALEEIHASRFQMCCPSLLPDGFDREHCHAPFDAVSSCDALLSTDAFRVCLAVYAFFTLVGNFVSFVYRVFGKGVAAKLGFDIFVTHLCVSDFLMGVYLAIVGIADRIYYGNYEWNSNRWKQSVPCQLAGFLSLLSSEVSAFLVCFITIERFLLLRFPHRNLRFTPRSAQIACASGWGIGMLLAAIPLLPFSPPWEFYSQTGICIPLPITRKVFPGSEYSFAVMIVFNFFLFLLIAAGQFLIFWSIRSQTKAVSSSSKKTKDMAIARRLLAVVMTDFLCWFPIGLLGLLARNKVTVSGSVEVVMAIFVLPFNSALNPFLYTFHVLFEQRRLARARRLSGDKSDRASTNCPACARRELGQSNCTPSVTAMERPAQSIGTSECGATDREDVLNLFDSFLEEYLTPDRLQLREDLIQMIRDKAFTISAKRSDLNELDSISSTTFTGKY